MGANSPNQEAEKPEKSQITRGIKTVQVVIPNCCRENLDSCPHKIKEPKPIEKNPI